ncbi:MAG TPA: HNH endonuclease signature motif containing protein [Acidimicrobiia bacterium]|nr:HNH endonuclease signature motif containing protein [Acidimicrobiia bacterium]
MYVIEEQTALIQEALEKIKACCEESGASISTAEMKAYANVQQFTNLVGSQVAVRYRDSGMWANEGYLSAKTAIVHETRVLPRSANDSLAIGSLIRDFSAVAKAVSMGTITTDCLSLLVPLASEKYREFFAEDVELLVKVSQTLSAKQFSDAVRHWKNMIDSVIEETSDEYDHFQNRFLYFSETMDGRYILHGEFDSIQGKILYKAIQDVSSKLWKNAPSESRGGCSPAQRRADSLVCIAQGYLSGEKTAIDDIGVDLEITVDGEHNIIRETKEFRFSPNPMLTADIVIDINDLDPKYSTHAFLTKCITTESPIISTHSREHLEQILCDTTLNVPIKCSDGTYDLGRTARTAPWKMKKQLLLSQRTCSIAGCTTPAHWCDAHHIHHWAHGGETKIDNLVLLCQRHHTMMHKDKTFAEKNLAKLKHSPPTFDTG